MSHHRQMFIYFQESRASTQISWEEKHHKKHHKCSGPTSTFFFWFFTSEHNIMWQEKSLCSVGVSCAGRVLSQLCVHLQPSLWGGRLGRWKGLDTESAAQLCQYVHTVLVRKSKQHHRRYHEWDHIHGRQSQHSCISEIIASWLREAVTAQGRSQLKLYVSFWVPGKEICS